MRERVADHISLELYPSVGFHGVCSLPDANADHGTLYAILREQSLQRDGAHEARRAEDTVFGGTPDGVAKRARANARAGAWGDRVGTVGRRAGATRELAVGLPGNVALRR